MNLKFLRRLFPMAGFALVLATHLTQAQEAKSGQEASALDKSFEELSAMSLEELLNLKITVASKKAERISDAAGVISVLTREELAAFGGLTLRDILERVPSLIGTRSYFSEAYGLSSRGDQLRINSGHNLILINGRPTREIVEGGISSEMYAAFPVDIIERIEVIRGPGSVLYGSNAFSTVINIVTQKNDENNIAVKALTGANGAVGAMGQAEVKLKDLSIVAAARYMKKGEWRPGYKIYNFFDPTAPPVMIDSLVADKAQGAYVGAQYKGLRAMGSHNQFLGSDFQFGMQNNKWSKSFANLGYDLKAADNWDMNFNVTYNYATFVSGPFPGITRYSKDMVAEWTNNMEVNSNLRLIFGGLYNGNNGKENMMLNGEHINIANKKRGSIALYTQADYWLLESLKIIGGIQANKVDNMKLDFTPRGGLIYYPAKRVNIKALYSQAYRAASIDEFSMVSSGLNGNPNLKPERVATMDFGVNYFGEKVQGGVNVFRSVMSDIISPQAGVPTAETPFPTSVYANHGKVTFKGIEAEGKYYVTRKLFFTGSMMYQKNVNDKGVENNTPIANFGIKGGISYVSTNGITASLFDIYQGDLDEKYKTSPFGNLNPKAGSYNVLNLYMNFNIVKLFHMNMKQGLAVFVQGDNILDQKIWAPDWGGFLAGTAIPVNRGRAIYAGLKVSLR